MANLFVTEAALYRLLTIIMFSLVCSNKTIRSFSWSLSIRRFFVRHISSTSGAVPFFMRDCLLFLLDPVESSKNMCLRNSLNILFCFEKGRKEYRFHCSYGPYSAIYLHHAKMQLSMFSFC